MLEINLTRFSISVLLAYFVVTVLTTVGVYMIKSKLGKSTLKLSNRMGEFKVAALTPGSDYKGLTDSITNRNLFNSDGKFPERVKETVSDPSDEKKFDEKANCRKTKIPISLTGTIVAGRNNSFAIVQETGRTDTDVYRVGQAIFDYEEAVVHSVDRYEVVINNDGVKECLQLKKPRAAAYTENPSEEIEDEVEDEVEVESVIKKIKSEFVEKELGDGMANIINSARIVPSVVEGEFKGYKIYKIKAGSLYKEIGLRNGDILKKVNDREITAEDGSLLLESFESERKIVVEVLNKDKPRRITVLIE